MSFSSITVSKEILIGIGGGIVAGYTARCIGRSAIPILIGLGGYQYGKSHGYLDNQLTNKIESLTHPVINILSKTDKDNIFDFKNNIPKFFVYMGASGNSFCLGFAIALIIF